MNLDVLQAQKLEAERTRAELVRSQEKAERDLSFTEILRRSTASWGTARSNSDSTRNRVCGCSRWCRWTASMSTPISRKRNSARFHPGQKVDVAVDAYGGRVVEGTVKSISPASGAQFSLLPPDNATGNFTKVVQRVAVRIKLSPEAIQEGGLRAGLSVVARGADRRRKPAQADVAGRARLRRRSQGRRQTVSAVANATAISARPIAAAPPAAERFDKRKLAAFIFMVFGMFMAILDIQIVAGFGLRRSSWGFRRRRTMSPGSRRAI